uniref:Uncharacterized protein LOC111105857 n=1 Tax=Crassostrea virginica TaxID=6565 RepID=A0A8B8B095_CRAVI|nr:uncharacterized protein LOC111105857 [Crassostrea virginica]
MNQKEEMSKVISFKKWQLLFLLVSIVLLFYLVSSFLRPSHKKLIPSTSVGHNGYSQWPELKVIDNSEAWFKKYCMKSETPLSLEAYPKMIETWRASKDIPCQDMYKRFSAIFTITQNPAKVVIPESFAEKVKGWLGGNIELFNNVKDQRILFIYNEYTREQNVYNPLREKRPMSVPARPEREYVEEISAKSAKTCDFCRYKTNTAEDVFGRVEGEFSFTAANTFKLDHWHTLSLIMKHHPLNWTYTQFTDLMHTSQKWLQKAYAIDRSYKYPMLIWDMLPHGGASQIHPHVHNFLDRTRYQGSVENWRMAANLYTKDHPHNNYFSDLIMIHMSLGLGVKYGRAVALASLLPKKDNEVIIISQEADKDFFDLLYFTYRAFVDDMEKLCYSSGMGFPSLDPEDKLGRIPAFARLITRGPVEDIRSDISSLELFTAQNANTDPYKVIQFIRNSIKKRDRRSKS